MRITNANVGIGTPTPGFTLDVSGTARITNTLSAGATTVTSLGAGSGNITTTGSLSAGATTVTSLAAGSGNITTTGSLSAGATTVTSLAAGSGNITTTGSLSAGSATVTSLAAGSGNITTTGSLSAGATTVTSLAAGSGNITTTGSLSTGVATVSTLSTKYGAGSALNSSVTGAEYVCRDENNTLYFTGNGLVRSLTQAGVLTTIATMNFSQGIAYYDGSLYVADAFSAIRKIVISTGVVTTFAGSTVGQTGFTDNVTGTNARFSSPKGITVDSQGNLYVADSGNYRIRKITSAAVVSTVAGTGTVGTTDGIGGTFRSLNHILSTRTGDVWAGDRTNTFDQILRYITVSTGEIRSLNASGSLATNPVSYFTSVSTFGIDLADVLYIRNSDIITKRQGNTLTDVSLGVTNFNIFILTSQNDIVIFDYNSNVIPFSLGSLSAGAASVSRLNAGTITTSGALTAASASIIDVSLTNINGSKYFAGGASGRTFQLNYSSGVAGFTVTTFKTGFTLTSYPLQIATDTAGVLYVFDNFRIQKITSDGTTTVFVGSSTQGGGDGNGTNAILSFIYGIATDSSGNVYFLDGSSGQGLRKITSSGNVSRVTTGLLGNTYGITADSAGNVYTVNTTNHTIQKTTPGGVITTFAGSGSGYGNGAGTEILFNSPLGIVVDSTGNLYVADTANHRIRKVTSSGVASLVAGSGTQGNTDGVGVLATFNNPRKITINSAGTTLFVADNFSVRKIVIATGEVTTLAGTGTSGYVDAVGSSASFNSLTSIAINPTGEVYVSENVVGGRIRKLSAKSESTYASTTLTGGSLSPDFDSTITLGIINVPASTSNAKVVSFSLPGGYLSSISGQWLLGLYATVALSTSPTTFYFEIMDGTTSVANGSASPTSINLSTPLQLYIASLFVPSRTYSSSLVLNLYVTTQASSALTLQFSGSTLSYLNTTIQPYNNILNANEFRFRTANGVLVNSNGFTGILANPTPTLQVDGSTSIIGNLTVGGTANITGATTISNTLTMTNTIRNVSGTALVPTYTFTSDVSSGMFLPAASNLAWSTVGVERMRILSNGNVGIGTTNPQVLLDVNGSVKFQGITNTGSTYNANGSATYPTYSFSTDTRTGMFTPDVSNLAFATNSAERMRINEIGNVTINQNVGIRKAADVSYALDIKAESTAIGAGIRLAHAASTNLEGLRIQNPNGEFTVNIANSASGFQAGSAQGDVVLRSEKSKLMLSSGLSNAGVQPGIAIQGPNVGIGTNPDMNRRLTVSGETKFANGNLHYITENGSTFIQYFANGDGGGLGANQMALWSYPIAGGTIQCYYIDPTNGRVHFPNAYITETLRVKETASLLLEPSGTNLKFQMMLGFLNDWGGGDSPLWYTATYKSVLRFANSANTVWLAPRTVANLKDVGTNEVFSYLNTSYVDWIYHDIPGDRIDEFNLITN
jgi:hypothetical protein